MEEDKLMRDKNGFTCCDICYSILDGDGLCPLCDYVDESEMIFDELDQIELDLTDDEEEDDEDEDDGDDDNDNEYYYEPIDYDCQCAICEGRPNDDYIFILNSGRRNLGYAGVEDFGRFRSINAVPSNKSKVQNIPKTRMEYIAFDIEIVKIIPEGANWNDHRPYGISCAATLTDGGKMRIWHGLTHDGFIANQMSQSENRELVNYLQTEVAAGKTLITWNGAAFDLNVLAEESGYYDVCKELALQQIDMMFHIFCLKGFPLGLDKCAKGMGLPGKPPGMDGSLAPKFWHAGRKQDVLEYVRQDVSTTMLLFQVVEKQHLLQWYSERGNIQTLPFANGWLTVFESLKLPMPDTSWMNNPMPRSQLVGWITGQTEPAKRPVRKLGIPIEPITDKNIVTLIRDWIDRFIF